MSELLGEHVPDAASLRDQLKTFCAVFDGDPIDEREYIEIAVESTGADTTYANPTSHEFIDELRDFVWHQEEPIVSDRPVRAVVRDALRARAGHRAARRPGRRRAARRLRAVPARLPAPAAQARATTGELRARGRAPRATCSGRWRSGASSSGASSCRRASCSGPDFLARTTDPGYERSQVGPQATPAPGPAHLQPAVPAALRGPQLHGVQHRESRVPYLDQELVDHILSLPDDAPSCDTAGAAGSCARR